MEFLCIIYKTQHRVARFVILLMSNTFGPSEHAYYINFAFDCNSEGVVYLIICKKCKKIYVGSTVTCFRKRFNNHKCSLIRYGKGQRGYRKNIFLE